jgi:hypothetical protein
MIFCLLWGLGRPRVERVFTSSECRDLVDVARVCPQFEGLTVKCQWKIFPACFDALRDDGN